MSATVIEVSDFRHKSGERVGTYVLDKPLGAGGFAEVWQAIDADADRRVALKIFYDRVTNEPTVWKAIREEPKKQPEHARIVPIYYCHLDSENTPGPYYVVMKLMQGGTLEERMRSGTKMPPKQAVGIIRDVLAGLEFAHNRGIIHRDIKPTNILFDAESRASLADFGIAKDLNKKGNTTIFGTVVGTATYMSHEQGEGLAVTKATDIYSLGTVLYEMLAGKVPFDGPTDMAIIVNRSKSEPPPLKPILTDIPERLEKVVLNCLERNLDHRYQDCNSLRGALDWAEQPEPIVEPKKKQSVNWRLLAGTLAALIVIGVALFLYLRKPEPSAAPKPLVAEPKQPLQQVVPPAVHSPVPNIPQNSLQSVIAPKQVTTPVKPSVKRRRNPDDDDSDEGLPVKGGEKVYNPQKPH